MRSCLIRPLFPFIDHTSTSNLHQDQLQETRKEDMVSKNRTRAPSRSEAEAIDMVIDAAITKTSTSRKQRKQLQKQLALAINTPLPDDSVQQPPVRTKKASTAVPASLPAPMSAVRTIPLLICSVGNPGSTYANTLHSAGHTVLKSLAEQLSFTSWSKERALGNGLVSRPVYPMNGDSNWTLWQSTSLMNISGSGVRSAYTTWLKGLPDGAGKLVVVHDELEKPLGAVNVNARQGASAKGHNGLKSIMSSMGKTPFVRIGVGIGRPVSRESKDVASYVLRKMTGDERKKVEGSVDDIVARLRELERG